VEALPERTGRRLALLIATSAYSDPGLRQLRAPGRDASELAGVLRDPRIGRFDVQTELNAVSGELLERIEDFCADRRPDDQLLIYLSCHGVLDHNGRLYYAAANTRRQRLAATAVAAAWLNERLEDCRARSQIVILDCCHNGAFARGAKGDVSLALQQRFEPRGRGRVVLTASRDTEYSFEGAEVFGDGLPSVFTHAIVTGLRTGEADHDKDGLITVRDLYHYLVAYSVRGPIVATPVPSLVLAAREATPGNGHIPWLLSRPRQRYLYTLTFCLLLFTGGIIGFHSVREWTTPSAMMGWIMTLGIAGALLSLWFYVRGRRASRKQGGDRMDHRRFARLSRRRA
jgi:hypothetical protein